MFAVRRSVRRTLSHLGGLSSAAAANLPPAPNEVSAAGLPVGVPALAAPGLQEGGSAPDEPVVLLNCPDRLVLFKPPGWEADVGVGEENEAEHAASAKLADGADDAASPVSSMSCFLRRRFPTLHIVKEGDVPHQCGLLHRLDVPSSGLLLMAKTHEAFYDLKLQLSLGDVVREYVVLCRGWTAVARRGVQARVHHFKGRHSLPGAVVPLGKNSLTKATVLGHLTFQRALEMP